MAQYPSDLNGIGAKLKSKGENITPEEVDEITGNTSWTNVPACSECRGHAAAVVLIGEDFDYDSMSAYVCKACLGKAADM